MIQGTERKISPDYCLKSKMIGYGICTSVRIPFAFREYEAPYFPLSGPAHYGVKLVRGDEKLTTYQFLVKMEKKGNLISCLRFSKFSDFKRSYFLTPSLHRKTRG